MIENVDKLIDILISALGKGYREKKIAEEKKNELDDDNNNDDNIKHT